MGAISLLDLDDDGAATCISPRWSSAVEIGPSLAGWTSRRHAAPGRRLGPYQLVERLGRGRQADVWRAVRIDADHRSAAGRTWPGEVALKVLPASDPTGDPRRTAQLRHEAERGARFADPSLLPTCDFGEDDGLLFLAMPLVVGCTLGDVLIQRRAYLEGRTVPADAHRLARVAEPHYSRTVAALLARVARAVHAAHGARVVHRDIKPMNILVRYDLDPDALGQGGRSAGMTGWGLMPPPVFLCDFGLARDLDVATPCQLRDGAGSPLYMAPERLLKYPADEVRCDVFGLGVTLYEASALMPPVEVPPELPSRHWADYLASATPRPIRTTRPGLCARLEEVVHRAMDRDPAQRHPTAAAFADDLERTFVAASPITGRRAGVISITQGRFGLVRRALGFSGSESPPGCLALAPRLVMAEGPGASPPGRIVPLEPRHSRRGARRARRRGGCSPGWAGSDFGPASRPAFPPEPAAGPVGYRRPGFRRRAGSRRTRLRQ
ncbi:MAG: serine/threonine-protein kinase [Isosphaeraceae bacterium]